MSSAHTHCGVGIAFDRSGRWWATQLFGRNYNFGNEGGSASVAPPRAAAPAPAPAPGRAPAPASTPGRTPGQTSGGDTTRSGPDVNSDVTFEAANPSDSRDFSVGDARGV
ncbi:hypothetical protein FGB62_1g548 [Gracilaria domingensis]|nr:hypothetical protein FGB62_1g548 [Gracilaria domingensis]